MNRRSQEKRPVRLDPDAYRKLTQGVLERDGWGRYCRGLMALTTVMAELLGNTIGGFIGQPSNSRKPLINARGGKTARF
jgi:hypothetical protein